jgi:pimeloyl-ACP methyl ester carboxylesterase
MSRRRSVRAVALAATLLVTAGVTACQPRPPAKDRPVIFIHGWSAFGNGVDCTSSFGSLETSLRAAGFTGPMVTIGFYDADRNCDVSLRDWGSIDNGTSWRELSKVFSRYVYETYTKHGIAVDVVGHSMGGLIVRGAVKGTSAREAGFSAPLKVEDVVTLAAPHEGAAWYSSGCLWGQCSGLKPGASEITWVKQDGNPQGVDGTEWTVLGSGADDVVPAASALAMFIPEARKVRYNGLEHSDYQSNATAQARVAKALAELDA